MSDSIENFEQNPAKATMSPAPPAPAGKNLTEMSAKEVTAISHLYRAEAFRTTSWRTRLDTTTNWAIVTTGLALSLSFADKDASPLPLMLVGLLVCVFMGIEARRYRLFRVWRARSQLLEQLVFIPILEHRPIIVDPEDNRKLTDMYVHPAFKVSFIHAMGRRLRRNYSWIFGIQGLAYFGKILIHPTPTASFEVIWERLSIGPFGGWMILLISITFHASWITLLIFSYFLDRREGSHDPFV